MHAALLQPEISHPDGWQLGVMHAGPCLSLIFNLFAAALAASFDSVEHVWMRFRRRRDRREAELSLRPISNRMLLLAVVAVAVAGGGLTWWLLSIAAADPNTSASVKIEAIKPV